MRLAVAGGKGGVGKSTVALNLAAELDAVVMDADLGMADLPVGRGPDLHDVLAGRASPVEAVRDGGPVAVLPCGRSLAGTRAADPRAIAEAVETVATEYGRVVIDCPAGMAADAGVGLLAAETCVLVTTPERTAVPDAVRTRALARELGTGLRRVALNRVGDEPPTDRVAETLGAPVTPIPEHPAVERVGLEQSVRAVEPDSEAAAAFRTLANGVA